MQKLFRKSSSIKIVISLVLITLFLWSSVFAADTSSSGIQTVSIAMNEIVSFLSRAWVLFAVLAGKLMTNAFVYASFMHMDSFLWQMRNIMKNFANFTIGFMFLFYLIKNIFSSGEKQTTASFIKEKVVSFLVAGILIQMSWFLVGAVVDLSTVATSAIGAFPASMIEENSKYQWEIRTELEKIRWLHITRDANANSTDKVKTKNDPWAVLGDKISKKELDKYLDAIIPNENSLSGPLIFMGTSLFRFQDFTSTEMVKLGDWEKLFITWWIQLLLLVMFSLAMFILFLLNIARIVILWMVIVFIPFIILFEVLKTIGKGENILEKLKLPNIWQIIKMIFAPVIFTAFMSLMLIVTLAVWWMLNSKKDMTINELNFVQTEDSSSISIDDVASSTVQWLKMGFADMLVYFLLIFLLWMLIKLAITVIGKDQFIVSKVINPLMQWLEKMPAHIPILSTPSGKKISFSTAKVFAQKEKNEILKWLHMDESAKDAQENAVRGWLRLGQSWQRVRNAQLTKDISSAQAPYPPDSSFFTHSKSYAQALWWLSLQNSNWASHVEEYLKKTDKLKEKETLEDYFKKDWNALKFAKAMWVSSGVTEGNIMSYKFGAKK